MKKTMKTKLLIVEDDEALCYMEKCGLEDLDYDIVTAHNGKEGLKAFVENNPDVVLSDVDMPVMNGLDMVRQIREMDSDVIIIFTSALTSPDDVSNGYKLGVNNYVKKPFAPQELDAHIKALLRLRNGGKSRSEEGLFTIGCYNLDVNHITLLDTRTQSFKKISQREAQILGMLAENMGEVVSKDAIIMKLWNAERDFYNSRSLDVFTTRLRKLFNDESGAELLTIRNAGFVLKERH